MALSPRFFKVVDIGACIHVKVKKPKTPKILRAQFCPNLFFFCYITKYNSSFMVSYKKYTNIIYNYQFEDFLDIGNYLKMAIF